MKNKLLSILINPYFLSLIFSGIIILSLPPIFSDYNTELIEREKTSIGYIFFSDLNNDSFSEKVEIFEFFGDRVGVKVFSNSALLNQWNYEGEIVNTKYPFTGDINGDERNDLFIFTLRKDTIYIDCFNPFLNEHYIKQKPIATYNKSNGELDCVVYPCQVQDTNNDTFNEFYFSICTTYSNTPRVMFAFDTANDTIYSSPQTCTNIWAPFSIKHSIDDKFYFSGNFSALATCDLQSTLSDWYSWFFVLDNKMNFVFEPVQIGYYPSELKIQPLISNDSLYYIALNIYYGAKDYSSSIILFNSNGYEVKKKDFTYSEEWMGAKLLSTDYNNYETFYILKQNGIIEEMDCKLTIINSVNTKVSINSNPIEIDIDNDGQNEFVFVGKDNETVVIAESDFENIVSLDITGNNTFYYCTKILNGENEPQLYLACDNYSYVYSYNANVLRHFKYVIYIGIFVGTYLFVSFIQKSQKHRIEQKYKTEKQIVELQLKALKSQIDPHFILNITNSIGSLIIKHDEEKTNYLLGKYGKLLRITLEGSDSISTTIETEIEYVKNYLILEKFRMNEKFDFEINLDSSLNRNVQIPKMLIHTFVENSIKHGIKCKKGNGFLSISVKDKIEYYEIIVRDNGIGRKKAKEIVGLGTGKGLSILDQILDLYYSLEKIKISYQINDLIDEQNEPNGTEVQVKVPKHS